MGIDTLQVIKGCWQLSGGHGYDWFLAPSYNHRSFEIVKGLLTSFCCCRGERESDRTSGKAAVEDFKPFVQAGITTFDTAGLKRCEATE